MGVRRWRLVVLGAALLVGAVLAYALFRPGHEDGSTDLVEQLGKKVGESLASNVKFGSKLEGYEVTLGTCHSEDQKSSLCDDVRIVYQAGPQGEIVVTANQAQLDTTTKVTDLVGDVVVKTSQATMRTDKARYLPAERLVTGEDAVQITAEGLEIDGKGFEIEVPTQTLRIKSEVKTHIETKGGAGIMPASRSTDGEPTEGGT
jgi:hypothetical protein